MATDERTRKAMIEVVVAVGEAIRDLGEVPSGRLYAVLMGKMGLGTYQGIIGTLKSAGLVTEANHVLKWVGPRKVEG